MEEYPREIELPGGGRVLFRPMERKDERTLLEFFRSLPPRERVFLAEDVTNSTLIHQWAQDLDYDKVLPLLAFSGESLVADGTLHRSPTGWSRHVGKIRLVVSPEFRRRGLARLLATELVRHAMTSKLEKLVAEVVAEQAAAREVFTRLGFCQEAVLKGHVLDARGEKHDLHILSQDIAVLWERWRESADPVGATLPMED